MNIPEKNWLEWSVFGLSLLLVLVVLSYLSYSALSQADTPPDIVAEAGEPISRQGMLRVPVSVTNRSSTAAQSVEVEVELDGAQPQQGHFVIDLLPPHATQQGWVAFASDPQTTPQISARVVGYQEP